MSRSLRRRPTAERVLLPSLSNSSSRGVWSSSAGRQWLSVLLLLHGLELVCQREGAGLEHNCGVLRRKLQLRGEEGSSSLRVRHKRGPQYGSTSSSLLSSLQERSEADDTSQAAKGLEATLNTSPPYLQGLRSKAPAFQRACWLQLKIEVFTLTLHLGHLLSFVLHSFLLSFLCR